MNKRGYAYILASKKKGILYVGVTSHLQQRIHQHKSEEIVGFTKKYHIHFLVWFQEFSTITEAIAYEKVLKGWSRDKKIALIEAENPYRDDLSEETF